MARPREFDSEELLDKVALAFLENGLQSTSMRQLETLTGVKQVSLYNAFGSKEGLFLAAFDRYTEQIGAAFFPWPGRSIAWARCPCSLRAAMKSWNSHAPPNAP
jgi:AcrR family transcriptional regulator